MNAWRITTAASAAQFATGRRLFEEYAATLSVDLRFQNFTHELDARVSIYSSPHGLLLPADSGDAPVGCVAVRRFNAATAERKRLYVQSAFRCGGTGRELLQRAIEHARRCRFRHLVLDTLPDMHAASPGPHGHYGLIK